MKSVIRNVLSPKIVDEAWDLYRNTTNIIELDGRIMDRHTCGMLGVFLLSKYTKEEFKNIWQEVKPKLVNELSSDVELVYCRILKYGLNGHIVKHTDSYFESRQNPSDLSIIIQLSDPNSYKGGQLIISKELMDLQQGDMLIYTYEHEHEVKPVKEGIRYVINLRCKIVK
jgi:hypothetical protein